MAASLVTDKLKTGLIISDKLSSLRGKWLWLQFLGRFKEKHLSFVGDNVRINWGDKAKSSLVHQPLQFLETNEGILVNIYVVSILCHMMRFTIKVRHNKKYNPN